jgi:hypothetical protein
VSEERAELGLCADCRHARVQENARGSRFWRCLRAETDLRFARYPRLPVRECPGYERADSRRRD